MWYFPVSTVSFYSSCLWSLHTQLFLGTCRDTKIHRCSSTSFKMVQHFHVPNSNLHNSLVCLNSSLDFYTYNTYCNANSISAIFTLYCLSNCDTSLYIFNIDDFLNILMCNWWNLQMWILQIHWLLRVGYISLSYFLMFFRDWNKINMKYKVWIQDFRIQSMCWESSEAWGVGILKKYR